MDFQELKNKLAAIGYSEDTAYAKIAHDIVLKAVRDSGFHDNLTVKGGVVMSSLTDVVRRATMDMDLDFLRYPLTNEAIRKFVSKLNRVAPCRLRMVGKIETLHQQEYKGKRVHLSLTDEMDFSVQTKVDIGVHTRADVAQSDLSFRVVTDNEAVELLANPPEQIFVEKLKSLLWFGSASTRFKDIYDMCYLLGMLNRDLLNTYLKLYIYDDALMRENVLSDIEKRLHRVFGDKSFIRALSNPTNAWLDVPTDKATSELLSFLSSLA
jgi:predicted nucleotidyltransferase component of viral defense system